MESVQGQVFKANEAISISSGPTLPSTKRSRKDSVDSALTSKGTSTAASTSRRAGLRATKRIDYSTLEDGFIEEDSETKKPPKNGILKKKDSTNKSKNKTPQSKDHGVILLPKEEQIIPKEGEEEEWADVPPTSPYKRGETKKGTAEVQKNTLKTMSWGKQVAPGSVVANILPKEEELPAPKEPTTPAKAPKGGKVKTVKPTVEISAAPTRTSARIRATLNYAEFDKSDNEDQGEEEFLADEEELEQEEEFVDDVALAVVNDEDGGAKTVEKILSRRERKDESEVIVEEYLVKWKGQSYLHLSWVTTAVIEEEHLGKNKLIKFLKTYTPLEDDEEPFNPEFIEIDRILSQGKGPDGRMQYLVKWKSLNYTDATWEFQEDINDDEKITQFIQNSKIPTLAQRTPLPKPHLSEWKKIEQSPVYKGDNVLRPYQLEGLNWLVFCWYHGRNSILADEMGLGKTVQSVVTLDYLKNTQNSRGPFLVIAPLSTIQHWKREFESWTDMNVVVYHGNHESRSMIQLYDFHYRDTKDKAIPKLYKFNVVITTYEIIMHDRAVLQPIEWKCVVVDEAHRLKNKTCRLTTELRTFKFDHLILLTGTPLQNNTEELWTLLNFLEPATFKSLSSFLQEFGDLKEAEQVAKLHAVLRPYLLRRMKENVEKSIAPKEETIVEVELTTLQKKYYRAIYERNFTFLKQGCKTSNMPSLLNVMMELRKCCNHPYLIKGVEQSATQGMSTREELYDTLIQASGKMVLIDKLLPKLKAGGHKVLIFSQMVRVLDILEDYLVYKGYIHERLDGRIRGNDRQAAIDRFCKPDGDRFVFLLCTRAGGLGINLTAADTVIIFDSDWNPQNDIQAQARCHRIGQDKAVKVYRLITRNTYEKHMFERASKKLGLDQAVLTKMNSGSSATDTSVGNMGNAKAEAALDKKTIDSLLKYGAYDLFRDDDTDANRFYEADIDQILERATVVKQTPEQSKDTALSSFSKASFVSNAAVPDLDVNDPDFWNKLLPDAKTAPDPRIQTLPRVRRQVHRFGGADEDSDLDDEELELSDEEDTKKQKEKGWTSSERSRFKIALMCLGYGRWKGIKELARLTRWSEEEIARYAEAFVRKCAVFAEVDELKTFELLNTAVAVIASAEIAASTYSAGYEAKSTQDVVESTEASSSGAKVEATTTEPAAASAVEPSGEDKTTKTGDETSTITLNFDSDPSLCDPKFQELLAKTAKQNVRRIETLAQLVEMVHANCAILDEMEVPDPPAPWWGLPEDKDLLLGSYRYGFGRYEEIRNDQSLCFWGRAELAPPKDELAAAEATSTEPDKPVDQPADETSKSDDSSKMYWPSSKILSHRVKRIIRAVEIHKKQQEKENSKQQKASEKARKEEERLKKKQELAAEWTKREKVDFYRALVTYGVPVDANGDYNWEIIRQKANLKRKTPNLIELYYAEFLTQCRNMIFLEGKKRLGKRKKGKEKSKLKHGRKGKKSADGEQTKDGGDSDLEDGDQEPDQDEELGEVDGALDNESPQENRDDITFGQCRRVVQRILMFSNLRTKVLNNEDLDSCLKRAVRPVSLPKWWTVGVHDKGLLQGVEKHGFGQWEDICADPDLPFLQVAQNPDMQSKRKRMRITEDAEDREMDADVQDEERDKEREGDMEDEVERDNDDEIEIRDKRKRKKKDVINYAEIINFPKDVIVMKRLESLINLVVNFPFVTRSETSGTTPAERDLIAAASTKNKKQTSMTDFAVLKGGKKSLTRSGSGSTPISEEKRKRNVDDTPKTPRTKRAKSHKEEKRSKKKSDGIARFVFPQLKREDPAVPQPYYEDEAREEATIDGFARHIPAPRSPPSPRHFFAQRSTEKGNTTMGDDVDMMHTSHGEYEHHQHHHKLPPFPQHNPYHNRFEYEQDENPALSPSGPAPSPPSFVFSGRDRDRQHHADDNISHHQLPPIRTPNSPYFTHAPPGHPTTPPSPSSSTQQHTTTPPFPLLRTLIDPRDPFNTPSRR